MDDAFALAKKSMMHIESGCGCATTDRGGQKSSCEVEQHQDAVMEYMLVSECGQKSN